VLNINVLFRKANMWSITGKRNVAVMVGFLRD
jgi:hypothetical protein